MVLAFSSWTWTYFIQFLYLCVQVCMSPLQWLIPVVWCVFSHLWPDQHSVCLALFPQEQCTGSWQAGRHSATLFMRASFISQQNRNAAFTALLVYLPRIPAIPLCLSLCQSLPPSSRRLFFFFFYNLPLDNRGSNKWKPLPSREKSSLQELRRLNFTFFFS